MNRAGELPLAIVDEADAEEVREALLGKAHRGRGGRDMKECPPRCRSPSRLSSGRVVRADDRDRAAIHQALSDEAPTESDRPRRLR